MFQKERRSTWDWVNLVHAVQWALNTTYCERWYGSTPYHVMFGQAPKTFLSTFGVLDFDRLEGGRAGSYGLAQARSWRYEGAG